MMKSLKETATGDSEISAEAMDHSLMNHEAMNHEGMNYVPMEMPAHEAMKRTPEMMMEIPSDMKMTHDSNLMEHDSMPEQKVMSDDAMTDHGAHQHD
jgi:hypothetical protein